MSALPNTEITSENSDCEIISSRIFNFPRQKVFRAWIEPNHLKNWWGPKGFTNTFHEFDLRENGNWKFIMHGPDGKNYNNECVFLRIEKQKLLVWNHISNPQFQMNVSFEEVGERTRIIFKMIFLSKEICNQLKPICVPSNEENFDKLETELAKMFNEI